MPGFTAITTTYHNVHTTLPSSVSLKKPGERLQSRRRGSLLIFGPVCLLIAIIYGLRNIPRRLEVLFKECQYVIVC